MSTKRELVTFRKKKVIFRQGDTADCMYRIDYGMVDIYLNYKEPNEKKIATLREDEFFGEMALVDDTVRSATAVAASDDTRLEVFPRIQLAEMLESDSASFRKLLAQMSANLQHLTENYLDVCRTISAYQAANGEGRPVDDEVRSDLSKYADLYKRI